MKRLFKLALMGALAFSVPSIKAQEKAEQPPKNTAISWVDMNLYDNSPRAWLGMSRKMGKFKNSVFLNKTLSNVPIGKDGGYRIVSVYNNAYVAVVDGNLRDGANLWLGYSKKLKCGYITPYFINKLNNTFLKKPILGVEANFNNGVNLELYNGIEKLSPEMWIGYTHSFAKKWSLTGYAIKQLDTGTLKDTGFRLKLTRDF